MSRLWRARSQSPRPRARTRSRLRPRWALKSTSSRLAECRRRAVRRRWSSLRCSRPLHSASMSRPRRSSKLRALLWVEASWRWKTSTMKNIFMAFMRSRVGWVSIVSVSLEVGRAADVVVRGQGGGGGVVERHAVESGGEDVLDGAVAVSAEAVGAGAGGFQPVGAARLAQPQQAQAGAVTLFGVGAAGEDGLHHPGGGGAGLLGPGDDARRGPLSVSPMGAGHVLGVGRTPAPAEEPDVGRHPVALEEHLDGGRGDAGLDALVHQLVRHAVEVVLDVDVVVDVDAAVLPGGHLEAGRGQRFQRRQVQALEQLPAGGAEVLHEAGVELAPQLVGG